MNNKHLVQLNSFIAEVGEYPWSVPIQGGGGGVGGQEVRGTGRGGVTPMGNSMSPSP